MAFLLKTEPTSNTKVAMHPTKSMNGMLLELVLGSIGTAQQFDSTLGFELQTPLDLPLIGS